jgi:hypothetical protein
MDSFLGAAEQVRARATDERNPAVREILLDIERSFRRLAQMEPFVTEQPRTYDRPFFQFADRQMMTSASNDLRASFAKKGR